MADLGSSSSDSPCEPTPKKRRERWPADPTKLRGGEPDSDSDEEYYCPEGVKKMDHALWARYAQQIEESEGFDIVDYPGDCYMAIYVPVNLDEWPEETREIIEMATMAIKEYNKQNPETIYEFVKPEKANFCRSTGFIYYITFQAKEKKRRDAAVKTFQAKVWRKILNEKEVIFCRLKKTPANCEEKVASELRA